jgi:hypothetical protein
MTVFRATRNACVWALRRSVDCGAQFAEFVRRRRTRLATSAW